MKHFKTFFRTALAVCLTALYAMPVSASDETDYTNNPSGNAGISWWGTGKSEHYDVAAFIGGPQFTGLDMHSISFPIAEDDQITDFTIWISTELTTDVNKENVANVFSAPATVNEGIASVTLPTPYRITSDGVYIGLSFNVASRETDKQKKPVPTVTVQNSTHGLYVHSSRTYTKWNAMTTELPFQVSLSNLPEASARLYCINGNVNTAVGTPGTLDMQVINYSNKPISSLTLTYETSGNHDTTYSIDVQLPEPILPQFNTSDNIQIELPAFENKQTCDLFATLTKINGKNNACTENKANTVLNVVSHLPLHRPLMEEYTGMGCGYCPRGTIGMERMKELKGDRFVAVAHHCDDVISIFTQEQRPSNAPAQPVAWINRQKETDPYFGDNTTTGTFGIDKVWEKIADSFTPAEISLSCRWTDNNCESMEATATVTFVNSFSNADFRVAYMLVQDGMHGEPQDGWIQGNYYTGQTDRWPEDFNFLVDADRYIIGMTFDDVTVMAESAQGIPESLPADIIADVPMQHTGILTLANAVNLKGANIIQDKSKLRVVAIITNAVTGHVLNAAEARPTGENAIENITTSRNTAVKTEYHDITGRKIDGNYKGLTIKTSTYANGKRMSEKVFIR